MRWIEEDGRVTVFRNPSGYSNGNTFDFEGRQLSCEHGGRRVVRYEPNGTVTVIADKFQGKRLNSPNDIVVHPDGGIWFTDPTYGIRGNYEGFKGEPEIKEAVYRVDPQDAARSTRSPTRSARPNGICFSPDYKKLYVADTGRAARHQGVRRRRQDAAQRQAVRSARHSRHRRAVGRRRHPLRRRRQHLGGARPGVQIVAPSGERIGMIRLPETARTSVSAARSATGCSWPPASRCTSVYVETTGAHIA